MRKESMVNSGSNSDRQITMRKAARKIQNLLHISSSRRSLTAAKLSLKATTHSSSIPFAGQSDWRNDLSVGKEVSVWIEQDDGHWETGIVSLMTVSRSELRITVNTREGNEWEGPIEAPELLPIMGQRGITIKHLRSFVKMCCDEIKKKNIVDPRRYLDMKEEIPNPGHDKPLDFTTAPTWLVVELFVKPTSPYRFGSSSEIRKRVVPFVDLLSDIFPKLGGPRQATHFASHSWSSFFVDLAAAFDDLKDDAAIWICCFAMTQDDERLEIVDESEVFAEPLKNTDTTHVLVCDTKMHALKRMWVLFELLRSNEYGKVLQLRPLNVISNIAAGANRCTIQMSNTGCDREHDKKYINKEMEKLGGVKVLNEKVRKGMVLAFQNGIDEARKESNEEGVARVRALLGSTYLDQGQFADAAHELDEALRVEKELTETFRPHTIGQDEITDWKMRLGKACSLNGNDVEAIVAMREAIKDEENWINARMFRNTLSLVEVLRRSGNFHEATDELEKLKLQNYGGLMDSSEIADALLKNGQQLSHIKWHNLQAEIHFRDALKIHTAELGEDHLTTVKTKYNLGMSVRRQHRAGEAEDMYRQVHKVQIQHLDPNHLDILNTRMNIGIALGNQGNFEDASKELEEVVRLHKNERDGHPKLAIAQVCLGDVKRLWGDPKTAVKCYNDALSIYNAAGVHFKHKNELAWAHTSLAHASMTLKDWRSAKTSFKKALEYNRDIFGPHHPSVALELGYIGQYLRVQGDYVAAKNKLKEANAILDGARTDNNEHPEGLPWISKQMELCELKSSIILPSPVEVLALSKIGRCSNTIDWVDCFDNFCNDYYD